MLLQLIICTACRSCTHQLLYVFVLICVKFRKLFQYFVAGSGMCPQFISLCDVRVSLKLYQITDNIII